MDFLSVLISLIGGAVGGNVAGAAMKDKSLGTVCNSLTGIFGGGIGGMILQALGLFTKTGGGLDAGSIVANIGSGGVGGAILLIIVSVIKQAMKKA